MLLTRSRDLAAVTEAIATALRDMDETWTSAIFPVSDPELEIWQDGLGRLGIPTLVHRLDREFKYLSPVRSFQDIVATRSQKFRQNVRRGERAAAKHKLSVDVHVGLDAFEKLEPMVAHVAAASWKSVGRQNQSVLVPYQGVQRDFIKALLRSRELTPVTTIARLGSEDVISAMISVYWEGALLTLTTFHDGRIPEATPGLQVMGKTIDWAAEVGATRIEFNGNSSYLNYFSNGAERVQNLLAYRKNWRGRCLYAFDRVILS